MKIIDIFNTPWAIAEHKLDEMIKIYNSHLKSEKIDFKALNGGGNRSDEAIRIENGSAVIPVLGPITKRNSFFSFFFDASSSEETISMIDIALERADVEQIILYIDSPGGTVDGSFELADYIEDVKAIKPIFTFTDGMAASAAYLVASATEKIVITGKTNELGSIGVIAKHVDYSKQDEMLGVEVTEVVSGKYKNALSSERPLSEFGKMVLQDEVDYIFTLFANDVSKRRGVDVQTIVDWQAKIFIGEQAIEAGLADEKSTLNQLLGAAKTKKVFYMNKFELQDKHPELYAEVFGLGKAEAEKTQPNAIKQAVEEDRKRAKDIRALAVKGQEETAEQLIESGLSVGEAAIKLVADYKDRLDKGLETFKAEGAKPVKIVKNQEEEIQGDDSEDPEPDFMELVNQEVEKNGLSKAAAIKKVVKDKPEIHRAWVGKGGK